MRIVIDAIWAVLVEMPPHFTRSAVRRCRHPVVLCCNLLTQQLQGLPVQKHHVPIQDGRLDECVEEPRGENFEDLGSKGAFLTRVSLTPED